MRGQIKLFSTSRVINDHLVLIRIIKNIEMAFDAYTVFGVFYGYEANKITLKIFVHPLW